MDGRLSRLAIVKQSREPVTGKADAALAAGLRLLHLTNAQKKARDDSAPGLDVKRKDLLEVLAPVCYQNW
jgi:hypothetical protein